MASLKEIVIDSRHPASLARFWAGTLQGYAIRAYDDVEIARLASLGLTPESDPSVMVDGPGPTLCFQLNLELKTQRNRLHFELRVRSRADEIARLSAFGAKVRDEHEGFTVMLDPEGNEFCVVEAPTD
jgi:hypothetical protein